MQLYISEKSNAPQAVDTISGGPEVISAAMPIQTGHSRVGDMIGLSLKYSHSSQKRYGMCTEQGLVKLQLLTGQFFFPL